MSSSIIHRKSLDFSFRLIKYFWLYYDKIEGEYMSNIDCQPEMKWGSDPEENIINYCVYSIPYSCIGEYKSETSRFLSIRWKEHRENILSRENYDVNDSWPCIEGKGSKQYLWT